MADLPEETYGDEIECPYCHFVDRDSWEWNDGKEGTWEVECDCGHTFLASRHISVSYSGRAKP